MTRRTTAAILLLVMALVGCTSSSGKLTGSPPVRQATPSPAPSATPRATPAATVVTVFTPFAIDDKLADGIVIGSTQRGSCQASNLLSRSDALRCFLGNNIADPCFSAQSDPPRVVCATGPDDHKAVEVKLTGPLPMEQPLSEPGGSLTSGSPWTLTLANGETCGQLGGATTTLAGQRLNYGCDHGDIYGDPDRSTALWTVFYRPTNASTLTKVGVTEATF